LIHPLHIKGFVLAQPSVRVQFEKERELADMIRNASPADRPRAYSEAYRQLYELFFRDFPPDATKERNRSYTTLAFLVPFLGGADLAVEVGAGSCHLAKILAGRVRRVIAVDIGLFAEKNNWPTNLVHQVFDGQRIDLPANTADIVISDNTLEHLHPDDALQQLREMTRILKPSGYIAVLTPNRANGPHDVSAGFSSRPEGLHLKEYGSMEIKEIMRAAGCTRARAYIGFGGKYFAVLPEAAAVIESIARFAPRPLLRWRAFRWLLPNRFTGRKT
jgi:SAM-dependent methyltransferase